MLAERRAIRQLQLCDPTVFGDLVLTCQTPTSTTSLLDNKPPTPVIINTETTKFTPPSPVITKAKHSKLKLPKIRETEIIEKSPEIEKRRASKLVDQLLVDIYNNHSGVCTDYYSGTSGKSQRNYRIDSISCDVLQNQGVEEVRVLVSVLQEHVNRVGSILVRQLKRRDALRRQREILCDVITIHLSERGTKSEDMRFSITPLPGESGFSQWHSAMKMVVQLPEGIPSEFRRTLWLTLADRHLTSRRIDWEKVERNCFSEWSHPADAELGVQIVKDLHRTGCSLFCGEDGQENQALLKKVLLAYARWNKNVGYCQGFNMLAALILQVTDKCETDALKLMIYLIEGVLPDSYFADSLRGLSVDMAVFRELLRSKLPRLSRHLDTLQKAAKDGSTSYEPPLTNVFTMQWFLTLFCNCLPQEVVLRVWDLILLEGNQILLRTALAIWQALEDRIMGVRSADEFYCIMGVLTREMLEFGFVDANLLIKSVVQIGPLTELKGLREHYLYNINPWSTSPSQSGYEDGDKQLNIYPKEKLMLDIGVLKKQYCKLKQRQRQAHIIISAAVSRQPPRSAPVAINHLLLGRSALVPVKRVGPPKGAVPPPRKSGSTIQWKDEAKKGSSSSSSSDTELCDDPTNKSSEDEVEPLDEHEIQEEPVEETAVKVKVAVEEITATNSDNKVLMTSDNIEIAVAESTQEVNNEEFNLCESLDVEKSNEHSLVSDDGFDFEKFLEERIRFMKQSSVCSEESVDMSNELDRVSSARKNSERALEIIQENSLILHRILQCQSRYSPIHLAEDNVSEFRNTPSPLPLNESDSNTIIENPETFQFNVSPIETPNLDLGDNPASSPTHNIRKNYEEVIDPVSKYKDILEISKNLDEKYKALILDQPPVMAKTTIYTRPSDLQLPSSEIDSSSIAEKKSSPTLRVIGNVSRKNSPSRSSPDEGAQKSPSQAYNPFPVRLSTRQNKDVAVKLGLYKK
nr:uncharacterized protein LOC111421106 isoform X1 [Onthophagus taurus]